MNLFPPSRIKVIEALIPLIHETPAWDRRYEIEWYVHRCITAGFCVTADQVRMCAERFIAGKKKVTPPGTARRKREEKERRKLKSNLPPELEAALAATIAEGAKAIAQYKAGTEKALNALVGGVMKRYKTDPALVRELLIARI